VARWWDAGVAPQADLLGRLGVEPDSAATWRVQCERSLNAPRTHAAGRVFDAFAALLGLPPSGGITYEAQAAVRLEQAARRAVAAGIPPADGVRYATRERDGMLVVDWADTFRMTPPADRGGETEALALAFHEAVASAAVELVCYGFSCSPLRVVALTGGVMMNRILHDRLAGRLKALGAEVAVHRAIPPNDACIALGQAVAAGLGGEDENGEDRLCV